jgi:hypothetical protein
VSTALVRWGDTPQAVTQQLHLRWAAILWKQEIIQELERWSKLQSPIYSFWEVP